MYIIVGANGFLGSNLLQCLHDSGEQDLIATYCVESEQNTFPFAKWIKCDVTNINDILSLRKSVSDISNCTIFYFAACHNLDTVKRQPDMAHKINVDSLSYFLGIFHDAKDLFFASTDCVYGENNSEHPLFKENDFLNPISEYGKQKAECEELVRKHNFHVLRLPFILGPSLLKNKKHFYDNIIEKSKSGTKFTLADGLVRSTLDYKSVAGILIKLSKLENVPTTLNVCGDESLTKYDVGKMLEDKYNLPEECIVKVTEQSIQSLFFENRASSAAMDNSLLKRTIKAHEIKLKI